jgi:hypothetical protein
MTAYDEELNEAFTTHTNGLLYANAVRGSRGAAQELYNRTLADDDDDDAYHWYNMYMVYPRD